MSRRTETASKEVATKESAAKPQVTTEQPKAQAEENLLRDQPTRSSLKESASEAAQKGRDKVHAQVTAKNARMWDPEHSQWIESHKAVLATNSDWLKRQIEVGKIKLAE